MSIAEMAGYLAAALVFLTFYMKTMIPLRMIGICSNCMFIIYGSLDGLYPVLVPTFNTAAFEWPAPSRDAAANEAGAGSRTG
jgi:hypothetical protein